MFKCNSICKTKLWCLIFLVISILCLVMSLIPLFYSFSNNINLFLGGCGTVGTFIFSITLGHVYSMYLSQKEGIEELIKIIIDSWDKSIEFEEYAFDLDYLNNNFNNPNMFNSVCFKREVSFLYILGHYFYSTPWYKHHLYSLPNNFKDQIDNLCEGCKSIDMWVLNLNNMSLRTFDDLMRIPLEYNLRNSQVPINNFLEFVFNETKNNKIKEIQNYVSI